MRLGLRLLSSMSSGRDDDVGQVDEAEPKEQILSDLKDALRQVKAGQTFPISELWDGIDV